MDAGWSRSPCGIGGAPGDRDLLPSDGDRRASQHPPTEGTAMKRERTTEHATTARRYINCADNAAAAPVRRRVRKGGLERASPRLLVAAVEPAPTSASLPSGRLSPASGTVPLGTSDGFRAGAVSLSRSNDTAAVGARNTRCRMGASQPKDGSRLVRADRPTRIGRTPTRAAKITR